MHHSLIHGIHTSHPSSGSVVRLAKRWTSTHLLADLIPFEAIELLVAQVYTNRDVPMDSPATVTSGFLRFLHLLASHNWSRYVCCAGRIFLVCWLAPVGLTTCATGLQRSLGPKSLRRKVYRNLNTNDEDDVLVRCIACLLHVHTRLLISNLVVVVAA
jgi:hypothetical protein